MKATTLSNEWARLARYDFEVRQSDGSWDKQTREIYDRGHGAAVLPYDAGRGTILLVRQFRLPVHLEDGDGMLIEACAGVLEENDPEACVRREAEEELGYALKDVAFVCTSYSSPGSVTEQISCFTGRYSPEDKLSNGGGNASEGEDIEVLEMPLDEALALIGTGAITDMKTILLLQHLKLSLLSAEGWPTG